MLEFREGQFPQKRPDTATLKELKTQIGGAVGAELQDKTRLREGLFATLEHFAAEPEFVMTSTGPKLLSREAKLAVLDKLKETGIDDQNFWVVARDLLDREVTRMEAESQQDAESKKLIDEALNKSSRTLGQEKRRELEKKSEELIGQDPYLAFGDALVDAFSQDERYRMVGDFMKDIREVAKKLQQEMLAGKNTEEILSLSKNLLKTKSPLLPSTRSFDISSVLPQDQVEQLVVRRSTLERLPELRPRKWAEYEQLLQETVKTVLDPASLLNLVISFERKGWFNPQKIADDKTQPPLSTIKDALGPLADSHRVQSILVGIDEAAYSKEELDYLRCLTLKTAVEGDICSAQLAADFLTGKTDLEELGNLEKGVLSLLEGRETETGILPRGERVTREYKRLSSFVYKVAVLGTIGVIATNPVAREQIAQGIAQAIRNTSDFITSLVENVPQIDTRNVKENMTQEKPEEPLPAKKEDLAGQSQTPLPDRHFEAPKLNQQNMSWDYSAETSLERAISSSRGGISPEDYLNSSTRIAWQIDSVKKPSYLITKLTPYYEARDNFFSGITTDRDNQQFYITDNGISLETADLRFSAKRKFIGHNLISVPTEWGYHLTDAKVEVVDIQTNKVVSELPVKVAATSLGEQYLVIADPSGKTQFDTDANQEFRIRVGLRSGFSPNFSTEFISWDQDAQFADRSVLPIQVQSIIDQLNSDTSIADVEKVNKLAEWFRGNFTYSFDPIFSQYYERGNPSSEVFLRRFFGTGNIQDDPYYSQDQDLSKRGVCETVNTAFAMASRYLDLKEGQVVIVEGYVNNGFYFAGKGTLTEGQRHAWAVYIDRKGNYYNLDVTPPNIDQFTQEVLSSTRQSQSPSADEAGSISFQPEVWPNIQSTAERFPATGDQMAFNILDQEPVLDKIKDILEQGGSQPLDSWQIVAPEIKSTDIHRYTPDLLYLESSNDFAGRGWFRDTDTNNFSQIPLDRGYPDQTRFFEFLRENPDSQQQNAQMEDFTPELRGVVKLTGNEITLPHFGQISPRSISASLLVEKNGSITRQVLPLAKLLQSPDGINYRLVIDAEAEALAGKVVEIKYKTGILDLEDYPNSRLEISLEKAQEYFKPLVPKEWFGDDFAKFLESLDRTKTFADLVNDPVLMSETSIAEFIEGSKSDLPESKYPETVLDGHIKHTFVRRFILDHYQYTWNPDWQRLYNGDNPNPRQFLERVNRFRRLDPDTATTLEILATRTLKSEHGDFSIPIEAGVGYTRDKLSRLFFSAGMLRFSGLGAGYELVTGEQKYVYPVFYDYLSQPPVFARDDEQFTPGFYRVRSSDWWLYLDSDPLTEDQAARTLTQILPEKEREISGSNADFIFENTLPEGKRMQLALSEWLELRVWNWLLNDPYKFGEGLAGVTAGLALADWVRRRTRWWKDLSAKEFAQALDTASQELAIGRDNPLFRDLEDFYNGVLNRKYAHIPGTNIGIPLLAGIQKARAMKKLLTYKETQRQAAFYQPPGLKSGWEFLRDPMRSREFKKDLLTSGLERQRLINIAVNAENQFPPQVQLLARRFLHRVFRQPFLDEVLKDRMSEVSLIASKDLNEFPVDEAHFFFKWDYQAIGFFMKNIPRDLSKLAIADPDEFSGKVENLFEEWALNYQATQQDARNPTPIDRVRSNLGETFLGHIQNIGKTIVTEAMLPYWALIEQERETITKMQLERHRLKKLRKLGKKKK